MKKPRMTRIRADQDGFTVLSSAFLSSLLGFGCGGLPRRFFRVFGGSYLF
jgi:hypothetical protein